MSRQCSDRSCKKWTHFHARQVFLAQEEALARVVGDGCRTPKEDVYRPFEEAGEKEVVEALLCERGCQCRCHECDPSTCVVEAAMKGAVKKKRGEDGESETPQLQGGGATGITWGLLHPEPIEVFLPRAGKYFRLTDVKHALEEGIRTGADLSGYAVTVSDFDASSVRFVDVRRTIMGPPPPPPSLTRTGKQDLVPVTVSATRVDFEAMYVSGAPVLHSVVCLHEGSSPLLTFILAADHTLTLQEEGEEESVTRYGFGIEDRQTKAKIKDLLSEAGRGGYLTFLCYLCTRETGSASFSEALSDADRGTAWSRMQPILRAAREHVSSSARLSSTEELVRGFKQFRKAASSSAKGKRGRRSADELEEEGGEGEGEAGKEASSGTSSSKRLCLIDETVLDIRNRAAETGGSTLCFCGSTDPSESKKRMQRAGEIRRLASSFCDSSLRSSYDVCVNILHQRRLVRSEREALEQARIDREEWEESRQEAFQLRRDGRQEEALKMLLW